MTNDPRALAFRDFMPPVRVPLSMDLSMAHDWLILYWRDVIGQL